MSLPPTPKNLSIRQSQERYPSSHQCLRTRLLQDADGKNRNQQALVALSNERYAEAIALLTKAIFLHPLDPSYYFHRAEAYLRVLDFESCLANYEHFAGLLQKQVSDRQAALRAYRKSYPVLKRWPAILYTWAQILLDQKRYQDVIVALDKAEKLGIPRSPCLLRRALAYTGLQDFDTALECLYEITDLEPSADPEIYILRAEIHKHLGNVDYCNLDVVMAFSLAPTHKSLKGLQEWITSVAVDLKNKGFQEIQEGHAQEALWYLNHALSLDPQDWIASLKRGLLFQKAHSWDNALEDFLTVLNNPDRDTQRDPQVRGHIAQIYETMGLAAYQQGQIEEALTHFTTSLTYNPRSAQVWMFRADCYFTIQDYALTAKDLETARTLDPSHPDLLGKSAAAMFALGLIDVYAGRFDDALSKFDQAIEWDDTVPEFYFERGRIYFYHLKDIGRARKDISQTLSLNPHHAQADSLHTLLNGSGPGSGSLGPLPQNTRKIPFSLVKAYPPRVKSQSSATAPSKDKTEDDVAQITVKLRQPRPYIRQPKASQKETVEVKSQARGWSASTNPPVKVGFEECDVDYVDSFEKRSQLQHILNLPPPDIPQLPLKSGGPNTRPNSSLARTLQNMKIKDTIKE